jgi:hypothetical protein
MLMRSCRAALRLLQPVQAADVFSPSLMWIMDVTAATVTMHARLRARNLGDRRLHQRGGTHMRASRGVAFVPAQR